MEISKILAKGLKIVCVVLAVVFCVVFVEITCEFCHWHGRAAQVRKSSLKYNKVHVSRVMQAIISYYEFHGDVPIDLSDLQNDKLASKAWITDLGDYWGVPIFYHATHNVSNTVVRIWSNGEDRKPGGDGPSTDVILEHTFVKGQPEGIRL